MQERWRRRRGNGLKKNERKAKNAKAKFCVK